jgi:small-conductance mechanosensitive channel
MLKDLMLHTSGLTYGDGPDALKKAYKRLKPMESTNLAEMADKLAQVPLAFDPGTDWNYGTSIDVLGRVIEHLSAVSYEEYIQTTILASAGVLGIVAGLAAQSSLSNLFAGLQLAFTDAIRVDDVVVVEKEWGRIEEITLTYVVVHVWDDRRLILPSTYFTTTPFQNWTRKESAVLGAIDLDVDWRVPLDELRVELDRALRASDLWDERVGLLQVTDAVGSFVRLRVLVSGVDGPTVFDLRCEIREALVGFLQRSHAQALPRVRVESVPRFVPTRTRRPGSGPDTDPLDLDEPFFVSESESTQTQGLFTGSREAIERARGFTSSGDTGPIAVRRDGRTTN